VALLSTAILGVVGAGVLLLLHARFRPDLLTMLWLTIPITICFSLYTVTSTYLRSMRRLKLYSWSQALYEISYLVLGLVWAVLVRRTILSFMWAWLGAGAVVNLWMWYALDLHRAKWLRGVRRVGSLREMLHYGFPLVLTQLLTNFLLFTDRYMLEFFQNSSAVGLYSLGFVVGQLPLMVLFTLVVSASYPLIMHSHEADTKEQTAENLRNVVRYYVMLGLPAAAGVWLLARPIVRVFSSSDYTAATAVVPWVAASFFLSGLAQFPLINAHLVKKTGVQAGVVALAFIVNAALNLALLPRYSFMGACVALAGSMAFFAAVSWWVGLRLLPLPMPWPTVARATIGVTFMSAVLWTVMHFVPFVRGGWGLLLAPVGAAAYFAMLYCIGEFGRGPRRTLASAAAQ
jgi:O-antigen/teichoic acid export membrane protein